MGSEGTLGLITQVTLRLTPRPASRRALLASFHRRQAAASAVLALRRLGRNVPSAIEYMDGRTVSSTLDESNTLGADAAAFLLIEADGSDEAEVNALMNRNREITQVNEGSIVRFSMSQGENEELWRLRKAVPWWVKRSRFHSNEDVAVPPASVPELIERVYKISTPLDFAVYGHAGDGNFHVNPMMPADSPGDSSAREWEEALGEFLEQLYAVALDLGGTISGEHGIGRKRTAYSLRAVGPDVDAAARAVKAAFDPKGIMNPGVIFG